MRLTYISIICLFVSQQAVSATQGQQRYQNVFYQYVLQHYSNAVLNPESLTLHGKHTHQAPKKQKNTPNKQLQQQITSFASDVTSCHMQMIGAFPSDIQTTLYQAAVSENNYLNLKELLVQSIQKQQQLSNENNLKLEQLQQTLLKQANACVEKSLKQSASLFNPTHD